MDNDRIVKIEQIIERGFDFKFNDYISRGFEIAQKHWVEFTVYALLYFIVLGVIGEIPQLGFIANTVFVGPGLLVGFYIVANKIQKSISFEFGDFFKGFDDIQQLALAALVQTLIIYGSLIPFVIAVWDTGFVEWAMECMAEPQIILDVEPPSIPSWSFLLLLPAVYFSISYSWGYLFVVFYKMQFWEALESSRKIIGKQWGVIFLFYIVIAIISIMGLIAFCLGVLFTISAMHCMMYAAFEDVTQLNTDPGEDGNIEQHLIV